MFQVLLSSYRATCNTYIHSSIGVLHKELWLVHRMNVIRINCIGNTRSLTYVRESFRNNTKFVKRKTYRNLILWILKVICVCVVCLNDDEYYCVEEFSEKPSNGWVKCFCGINVSSYIYARFNWLIANFKLNHELIIRSEKLVLNCKHLKIAWPAGIILQTFRRQSLIGNPMTNIMIL